MWTTKMLSRRWFHVYFLSSCLVLGLVFGLVAYGQPPAASDTDSAYIATPNPTAEQLWRILSNPEKPYTSWPFFYEIDPKTGKPVTFPFAATELPHGDYVAVYVNEPALESLKNPSDPFMMKPGSILIKENYRGDGPPPSLDRPIGNRDRLLSRTVMWKVPGYNFSGMPTQVVFPKPPNPLPSNAPFMVGGEWFWAMFTPGDPAKVVTLGAPKVQGFLGSENAMRRQFNPYIGETQAGKSWFCKNCHVSATGKGFQTPNSYGDHIWRLVPFATTP